MKYIDEADIQNKRVLLRVDFNVSLTPGYTIADDQRIKQALPTIKHLLTNNNKIIIVTHLGRPKNHEPELSLSTVRDKLASYLTDHEIILINDFSAEKEAFANQTENQIFLLENIRYYKEELANDEEFAKKLANLADVYVNDGFSVAHRKEASIIQIPKFLPSYAGLLMRKEVSMLSSLLQNPKKPFVAILGGSKISTKLKLIGKIMEIADTVLLTGGLANNFFKAKGLEIGKSIYEENEIPESKNLIDRAQENHVTLLLPTDVIVGSKDQTLPGTVKSISTITKDDAVLDIGPDTANEFAMHIQSAATIVWNGPVGYFENPIFRKGSDAICDAIVKNPNATSIIGGGDTIAAIAHRKDLNHISHISTGGGAMLEFLENNGTLPGIEALG